MARTGPHAKPSLHEGAIVCTMAALLCGALHDRSNLVALTLVLAPTLTLIVTLPCKPNFTADHSWLDSD